MKGPASTDCEVVVVGAGPYGLSVGAHLKARGVDVRVFGAPMDFWANRMPSGMLLRSPRAASSISDPHGALSLEAYERALGLEPTAPVPLSTFVEYGRWFREKLGSSLDDNVVNRIRRDGAGFHIALQRGSILRSRRVVVAAGIGRFTRRPAPFSNFDCDNVSHCYDGQTVANLAGKRVAVIGAGQSALEWGALLHEAGSDVEIITRIEPLRWIGMHGWLHHLGPLSGMLYSKWDVGPIGISRLVSYPKLVSRVPLAVKDKIRMRAVRSAGSNWLPDRLRSVKISTGRFVHKATSVRNEVHLRLDNGSERQVDHVLLGTGYEVNIARYNFLAPELVADVRQLGGYPDLGPGFSTSVSGLHFVGATAARTFGPLLYFVAGTEFASKELTSYISKYRSGEGLN